MNVTAADLSDKHCNPTIKHYCHFLNSGRKISKCIFALYYEVINR